MPFDEHDPGALLDKALNHLPAGWVGAMVGRGRRLGLDEAMAGTGPPSAREPAEPAGRAERHVRKWLRSRAAGETVVDRRDSQTCELPPERAHVLADANGPVLIPPARGVPASMRFHAAPAGAPG